MPLTLYDFKLAPNPRRTRMLLAEKGVAYKNVQIDMFTGEHLGEAYRAINPNGTIPALKLEDNTVLTENTGIAAYLEAAYPEPNMLGSTPKEKGLVWTWNAKVESEGIAAVGESFRNGSPTMKNRALTGPQNWPQIPELAERGKARAQAFMNRLNERLAESEYVAIDQFSLADITAVCCVDFAKVIQVVPDDSLTHLHRWRNGIKARPSYGA